MNASKCRTSVIAAAVAGALATVPAFAATQAPSGSATRAPQHLVKFRGRINPSPTGSTSAAACPDAMRAGAQTSGSAPFHVAPSEPVVVVPEDAFASGQFPAQVRNATAHAQLARACAK